MKNFALIAAAVLGLFAATSTQAQNTQNAQDPAPAPSTGTATRSTVRRAPRTTATTQRTTTATTPRTTTATINARNNARLNARLRAIERAGTNTTPVTRTPRLDGGVVRAVRSDNPLQAVNPAAPAEYGTSDQVTRHEPDDPFQRPQGLKLLVVEF